MAGIMRTYITVKHEDRVLSYSMRTHITVKHEDRALPFVNGEFQGMCVPPHPPLSPELNVEDTHSVFCQVSTPSVLCRCFQDGNMAACVADIIVTSVVLESNSSEIVRQT
jgi:hypothetical protein